MFQKFLIPTDGSKLSQEAMLRGVDFARFIHARVILFTASPIARVQEFERSVATDPNESDAARGGRIIQERLNPTLDYARQQGVEASVAHAFSDQPFQAIIDEVRAKDCDLVFMASHGRRGIAGLLLGSETQKVLLHSKVPVLVFR
jgi:nucleotide-binding universal stress UspA family protein